MPMNDAQQALALIWPMPSEFDSLRAWEAAEAKLFGACIYAIWAGHKDAWLLMAWAREAAHHMVRMKSGLM